jgi:wyosine [tRNA(Phe)-imidazoG37] synthetase (radical SAM superfamily)
LAMQLERTCFYRPSEVAQAVEEKVARARQAGQSIDYLTFVPDGEPTLDAGLGEEIGLLRPLGIPIAVISNASLVGRPDVQEELMGADWVSLKVDAVRDDIWRQVDRPDRSLGLDDILEGALAFAGQYQGHLVTETMLVAGANDGADHIREVAQFVSRLRPAVAYLSIPTRPPAADWVRPPDESVLNAAYQTVAAHFEPVEYLMGYEGNAFAVTGDVEADLLSITAVHPMREDALRAFLARAGSTWAAVEGLLQAGRLQHSEYGGHRFYLRTLRRTPVSERCPTA